ncbi:MAG: tRNA uridine-5-carboxymethylaminomethyl(34) synthesis enzyme MnmG [Bacteroides sp.]|nr:tRNA uridine-5-carboxymethylaminomethyl(34) synthesis enzyme MnmG [Bacteroides sp.]
MKLNYDIVVVGGGHAGCEAAAAAANMGSRVLLLSMQIDRMAYMSCNPAMGGVAKGQIVREIDAMGGYSGIITDRSTLQFRMLNRSKGPAMWSPRAQCDMWRFSANWRAQLEAVPNLELRQDMVTSFLFEGDTVAGVRTQCGAEIHAKAVILTGGTFLNGKIHIGEQSYPGGRIGESASFGLSEQLRERGFRVESLKTGTPVRVDARTVDFSALTEQKGDEDPGKFSFTDTPRMQDQMSCFLAYTNLEVHDILRTGFDKSPMFAGRIKGRGPRYCPSIEDKIDRFADKDRHQLFFEPCGRGSMEYYLNGFSSSLPEETQVAALHKIVGFENARVFRPGYAIEYDYFDPTQLKSTLETKLVNRLYFAGQVNGTTGYEEAAGQGFMAGLNAHLNITGQPPLVLNRSQAYIGVLIDDLVTKGVDEPYRMFTSRAEYRILLRQDNADERLTPLAYNIGIAKEERMRRLEEKKSYGKKIKTYIGTHKVEPENVNAGLLEYGTSALSQKTTLEALLQRPQISLEQLMHLDEGLKTYVENNRDKPYYRELLEEVEISMKYDAYIRKEEENAARLSKYDDLPLKPDFDYRSILSLSYEAREKLSRIKPATLGQASRIPGVSPADISVLLIWLNR